LINVRIIRCGGPAGAQPGQRAGRPALAHTQAKAGGFVLDESVKCARTQFARDFLGDIPVPDICVPVSFGYSVAN
jgi:hypothetical protein